MAEKKTHSRPPSDDESEVPAKAEPGRKRKASGKLARGARDAQQADLAECNRIAREAADNRRAFQIKKQAAEQAAIDRLYRDMGA